MALVDAGCDGGCYIAVAGLAMFSETRDANFSRAASSGAHPRETKITGGARADFATGTILRSGFKHDPFLSRRTV